MGKVIQSLSRKGRRPGLRPRLRSGREPERSRPYGASARRVILFYGVGEHVHRALEILLLEHVGHADFVFPLAGRGVKRLAAGEHHCVAIIGELVEQPVLEGVRVVHGQGGHNIEGALRLLADDARYRLQLRHERVAAALILIANLGEIAGADGVECGGGELVDRGGAETALAPFHCLRHKGGVSGYQQAYARPAGGKALGHGVYDDDVVLVAAVLQRTLERLPAVHKFAVDLVADDEQPVLPGDIKHQLQLIRREHCAGGVAGVGHEDGTGMLVYTGLDPLAHGKAVALLGAGGHGAYRRARKSDRGVVVGIKGLGDDDLVPVVEQAGQGHLQRLAAAGGDKDLLAGQLHADVRVVAAHRVL